MCDGKQSTAKSMKLPCHITVDAGHTQIAPSLYNFPSLYFDGIFFMNLMHRTVLTLFHKTCLAHANSDRTSCLFWACSADSRTVLAILGN